MIYNDNVLVHKNMNEKALKKHQIIYLFFANAKINTQYKHPYI